MHEDVIDLEDLDVWVGPRSVIDEGFAKIRASGERPFIREISPEGNRFGGYYALSSYDDVIDVSKRPADFSSARGVNIVDMPADLVQHFGSIIAMDNPRHTYIRRIVAQRFAPKALNELKADVERIAAEIVAGIAEKGECDFVTEVAALVPLRIIIDMLGIPRSQEQFIFDVTNRMLGTTDPEYVPDQSREGLRRNLESIGMELVQLVQELAEDRIKNPQDDLITRLVMENADGEKLSPQELGAFFNLLVGAGNETTRNAITHGFLALSNDSEQRATWQGDFEAHAMTAVEEIVRYASPVLYGRRTVTADGVRIGDQEFHEGDKVVMWYYSANRDESVFDRPFDFDIARDPNPHVAFGGPGPHFCLGAHLARREITAVFRELFRQVPDIRAAGEPEYLRANFIHGIKHLRCEYTPTRGAVGASAN
ncbi:MAG: cytochrome P450 [Acidimicrobiia bacterium]